MSFRFLEAVTLETGAETKGCGYANPNTIEPNGKEH